jgi:hypothetical protein
MRNKLTIAMPVAALLALAGQLLAGGFYLNLRDPNTNAEARKGNAVLMVEASGCHDPATATLTGIAIGIVNGQRQSIPLTVQRLSGVATFAVTQQWPKEGKWVIELTAKNGEQSTNMLVNAGPKGVDRDSAKWDLKPFAPKAVDAMLQD